MNLNQKKCKICNGFCCTRTAFKEVGIYKSEIKRMQKLGANVFQDDKKDFYMPFSKNACMFLKNGRCSIYNQRPKACRRFDCTKRLKFGKWFLHNNPRLYKIIFRGE